jgi:hypothetical protein
MGSSVKGSRPDTNIPHLSACPVALAGRLPRSPGLEVLPRTRLSCLTSLSIDFRGGETVAVAGPDPPRCLGWHGRTRRGRTGISNIIRVVRSGRRWPLRHPGGPRAPPGIDAPHHGLHLQPTHSIATPSSPPSRSTQPSNARQPFRPNNTPMFVTMFVLTFENLFHTVDTRSEIGILSQVGYAR